MLSKYSVKKPYTVFVVILLILILGVISLMNITVDLVPSVNLPYLVITTSYVGASAEKVEKEVSKPIEESLSSIDNIKEVKSVSSENISIIILEFTGNIDLEASIVELRESLDMVKNDFEENVDNPIIMKLNPNALPIMMISLSDSTMNSSELENYIDKTVMSELKSIQGVATVSLDGKRKNVLNIRISEKKLDHINKKIEELYYRQLLLTGDFTSIDEIKAIGLDFKDNMYFNVDSSMIENIIIGQNFSMPTYNVRDQENKNIMVKVGDEIENLDELKNILITTIPYLGDIKIKDICDFELSNNNDEIYSKVDGKDTMILSIQKQSEFSTSTVTNQVWDKIEKLKLENDNLEIKTLMDQGRYVNIMIRQISRNLFMGAIFAIIVLFFFLRNIKATIIVTASIFISITTAIVLMYFTDISLNMISLGGLALAVGMLVDNSIVILENIFRYRQKQLSIEDASIKGAKEVSAAIIASTVTTIIVFLPIVFTQGLTRDLFTDMALTITFALISSLLVALTLVPTSTSIMKDTHKKEDKNKSNIIDRFIEKYVTLLDTSLRYKWVTFSIVIILFITSILTVIESDVALFPILDSGNIWIKADIPESYSKEDKRNALDNLYEKITSIDSVKTVGIIDRDNSIDSSNIIMSLAGEGIPVYVLLKDDRNFTTDEIRNELVRLTAEVEYPLTINSDGLDLSQLMSDDIVVHIFDDDMNSLANTYFDLEKNLYKIGGVEEVKSDMDKSSKELKIQVDKDESMRNGLTVGQIYLQISDYLQPSNKIAVIESNMIDYDVHILDDRKTLIDKENIADIDIRIGEKDISLSKLATVREEVSLTNIYRSNGKRYMEFKISVSDDYNLNDVNKNIEIMLKNKNIDYELSGEVFEIENSFEELYFMMIMAVILIYLIMVAQFQSLKSPFIVMFTILLALTGGFLALYFTGYPLSIISIIGLIVLVGIVVNNGIVFVDYSNQQMKKGLNKREALLLAGRNRLRPILMTAFTTITALLASALDNSMGSEMLRPMAITTIGGMIYATILTLFLIPSLYDLIVKEK